MDREAWWAIVHGFTKSQMDMTEHVRTHMVVLFFKFQGTSVFFSIWLHQFTFLSVVVVDNGFFFLQILTNTNYLLFFVISHPSWYEVISHCGFIYVSQISDVEHHFMCP